RHALAGISIDSSISAKPWRHHRLWLRFRALVGPVRRLCAAGLRLSAARLFGAAATTVAPAGGAVPCGVSGIRIDGDRGWATARRARPRVSAGRWQLANREIEQIPTLWDVLCDQVGSARR